MKSGLQPTTIYLDEQQIRQIKVLSLASGKARAEVTRNLIDKGLAITATEGSKSSNALLGLCATIPKNSGLPKDLSNKFNEYTWDK